MLDHVVGIAVGDELALIEDQRPATTDSRAWSTCSIQTIVTPDGVNLPDQRDEVFAFVLVEAAGDLVQQHTFGLGCESPRQFQSLAVEKGQSTCR